MSDLEKKEELILSDETKEQMRANIAKLEEKMLTLPQVETPVTNYFSKSVYAREMFIPKGTLVIGKIHKHKNLNIISKGDVAVLSIDGIRRIKAPCTFVSSPGVKRVVYTHQDTVWTTIHGTDETDVEKIEDEFIAKTYDEVVEVSEGDIKKLKEAVWLGE